jgi:type II secretory pathway component PulF
MLHAGAPLGDAVREAARATGNRLVAQRVVEPAERLDRGGRLSEVLHASGIFSPSQVSQIVTAEESGTLAEGLGRIAESSRQSREQFLKGAGLGGCFTAFAIAAVFTLFAAIAGWTAIYDEIFKVFDSSAWQP